MKYKVTVKLKAGVLDPQGRAILEAAHALGFAELGEVRVGKVFYLEVSPADTATVRARVEALTGKLLANPVIEDFKVESVEP